MDQADKRRLGAPAPCICCGKPGPIMGRGLREACYSRWRRYGRLHLFPFTRPAGTYEPRREWTIQRIEAYRQLTSGPRGLSRNRACIVLSITVRTAYRYEAWIRAQQSLGTVGVVRETSESEDEKGHGG